MASVVPHEQASAGGGASAAARRPSFDARATVYLLSRRRDLTPATPPTWPTAGIQESADRLATQPRLSAEIQSPDPVPTDESATDRRRRRSEARQDGHERGADLTELNNRVTSRASTRCNHRARRLPQVLKGRADRHEHRQGSSTKRRRRGAATRAPARLEAHRLSGAGMPTATPKPVSAIWMKPQEMLRADLKNESDTIRAPTRRTRAS